MRKVIQIAKDLWDVFFAFVGLIMIALDIANQLFTWGYIKQDWVLPIGLLLFLLFGSIAIIRAKKESRNWKSMIDALHSKSPKIIFGEPKRIEITYEQLDLYGEKSLIGYFISSKPAYLFCIDFLNDPVVKNESNAIGAEVFLEFYDQNNERKKSYFGRWIDMPEYEFGVKHKTKTISCNGMSGERLGIAIINKKGDDFHILDSEIIDNRADGNIWNPPFLLAGKYFVIVTISGENFPKISKVYEIQNLKDECLMFSEKKDSEKWLQEIEKNKKNDEKIWSSIK